MTLMIIANIPQERINALPPQTVNNMACTKTSY